MELLNIALNKNYRYLGVKPMGYYADLDGTKLTDGKDDFSWSDLVGWDGVKETVKIEIDLEEVYDNVVCASAYFLMGAAASVGLPDKVEVSVSSDGKKYLSVGQGVRLPQNVTDNRMFEYKVEFEPLPIRYVLFTITPNPHIGWCMLSELKVYSNQSVFYDPNRQSSFAGLPRVLEVNGDSAKISWSTKEEINCQCKLRKKSRPDKDITVINLDKALEHELFLTDLLPQTEYEFLIYANESVKTISFCTEELLIKRGPILGLSDDGHLQISFETNALGFGYVEYCLIEKPDIVYFQESLQKRHSEGCHYVAILSDLEKGKRYGYRVKLDYKRRSVSSPVYEIEAFDKEDKTDFTFLVYGDTQHALSQEKVTNEMQKVKDVDFVLHVGDLVNQPGNVLDWEALFKYSGNLMARALFFPTLGNHDAYHYRYFEYFDLLGNKTHYSFLYGPLHVIALDSSNESALSLEQLKDQIEWLKEELNGSTQPYKIVFLHHPLFTSFYSDDTKEDLVATLSNLFTKHKVTLVFSGHAHIYDHIEKDGVHYVVTGGGGGCEIAKNSSPFNAPLHFVKVDVTDNGLKVTAIKPGGEVVDSFTIKQ